jgi:hypothetical protein
MNKFKFKGDIAFIFLFIMILTFIIFVKIQSNYSISALSSVNKNLFSIRKSIDEFYEIYNRYPNENEIIGVENQEKFIRILIKNINYKKTLIHKFKFPSTPGYVKDVDGILVEIGENNNIKICNKLENLGLDNEFYTSNGGWIYCPKNGEFRANLQSKDAKNKIKDPSRPNWARGIDWYYK